MSFVLPRIVALVLGDPSNDGHGISKNIILCTSYTAEEIWKFVKDAEKQLGVDMDYIASEYEQPHILKDTYATLVAGGVIPGNTMEENDEDTYFIYVSDFVEIFLGLAKLGNNGKSIGEIVKVDELDIGGYGLFAH